MKESKHLSRSVAVKCILLISEMNFLLVSEKSLTSFWLVLWADFTHCSSLLSLLILNKQMLPRKIWLPYEILNTELVNMEKFREFPAISWSVIYIYKLLPTIFLNAFQAKVQFPHPLKTSINFWFYDVFRVCRNVIFAWSGLNVWNPCVAAEK